MLKSTLFLCSILFSIITFAQPPDSEETKLYQAIRANNFIEVKQLITLGADVNEEASQMSIAPVTEAIRQDNLPMVKFLINHGATSKRGMYNAVSNNNIPMVEYLLTQNFTPGRSTVKAAENNKLTMLKVLVDAGDDVDYSEKRRRGLFRKYYVSPIGFAVSHNNQEMVLYLVEKGVPVNDAMNEAFDYGRVPLVKVLSKQVTDKGPLLLKSFERENPELISYFIGQGVNVNSENGEGNSMLLIAAKKGNISLVTECIETYKLYIHKKNNKGQTALMLAAESGSATVCTYLLEKGSNVAAQDLQGATALFYATDNNFELLIQNGAKIDHLKTDGDNLLIWATRNEQLGTVKRLHEGGMSILSANKEGKTAYYYVVSASSHFTNKTMMEDFFIEAGADINTQGSGGETAMFKAVESDNLERVKFLIEKGADINAKDNKGLRPDCDEKEIIMYLVKNGADIDALDDRHDSYLCVAVSQDDLELAHFLINEGIDPNQACYFEEAPIIKAVESHNLTLVQFLAENGADVNVVGYFKKNLMEYAEQEGDPAILAYLKSKGAMTKEEKNEQYRGAMELESKIKSALIAEDLATVNRLLSQNDVVILQRKLVENLAYVAAKQGNSLLTNKLLSDDVAFSLKDPVNTNGQTMLFIATIYNQESLVKDLLARGADINQKDNLGKIAEDYADKKSIRDIFKKWH
jgi:ankyrin repeat protein